MANQILVIYTILGGQEKPHRCQGSRPRPMIILMAEGCATMRAMTFWVTNTITEGNDAVLAKGAAKDHVWYVILLHLGPELMSLAPLTTVAMWISGVWSLIWDHVSVWGQCCCKGQSDLHGLSCDLGPWWDPRCCLETCFLWPCTGQDLSWCPLVFLNWYFIEKFQEWQILNNVGYCVNVVDSISTIISSQTFFLQIMVHFNPTTHIRMGPHIRPGHLASLAPK